MDFKIIYEQDYCEHLDITIIKENIYQDGDIIKQKISGFYYGEPSIESLLKFKDKNFIDNLKENKKDE